ncbi:MAG: class II aldolase/adducin family protein [Bacteroidia bacterium]
MLNEEGYIKYHCDWTPGSPVNDDALYEINHWRKVLFEKKLIGYDPLLNVGYGNISCRNLHGNGLFIISGTQTGHLPALTAENYTRVTDFDLENNTLSCTGPVKASSESLTHAAVYGLSEAWQGVIHIHHRGLWDELIHKIPTTRESVTYGTPEMAKEVQRLWREENLGEYNIFVMGGHLEGLVSFGKTVSDAAEILLYHFDNYERNLQR